MSLVRDESDRIVSLGLAECDVMKDFVESELREVIKCADGDKVVVLGKLTDLHSDLNAIRLPGDFEKTTAPTNQQLREAIGLELPPEVITDSIDPSDTLAVEALADDDEEDEEDGSEEIKAICSVLDKITYDLGKQGSHEAAYLVERVKFNIESLANKPPSFLERSRQTNQRLRQMRQHPNDIRAANQVVKKQLGI